MKVDEILSKVEEVAKQNNIYQPFMVGGVPRDRILGKRGTPRDIDDVDITTGNEDAPKLAEALSRVFPDSNHRTYDDGHSSIDIYGLHIDFSSHFVAPNIDEELRKQGVTDIDDMKREIYSRDFTINTLLESLDFTSVYDITREGIADIQAGLIKCPIDPNITIGTDPRRILRAIKFSLKYDFNIDDGLKSAMRAHREKVKDLPTQFVQKKMNEIVFLDNDKGLEMLIEYKLLPLVPLTKTISDILIQRRQLARAL